MGAARRADRRSALVFDSRALGRRAGAMTEVRTAVPAPPGLGIGVIGVVAGSAVELDLRLESVVEGVLVTGTAAMQARGECVRCLGDVFVPVEVDVQELFVHEGQEEDDEDVSRLNGDLVDLEPVLRDDVVLGLPFQPLCDDECPGLCPSCGARLADDPAHGHEADRDPRWAALLRLHDPVPPDAATADHLEGGVPATYNEPRPDRDEEVSR